MRRILFFACFLSSAISIAQSWINVGGGVDNEVEAFTLYNGNLIVGGSFTHAGGIPASYVAQWNGSTWSAIDSGVKFDTILGGVGDLTVYDSILYVAGQFDSVNNTVCNSIAQWNGTNWSNVGNGLTAIPGQNIDDMVIYNKELYACGNFATKINGKPVYNIVRWNGNQWDSVGRIVNGVPWGMTVWNGRLYVGGIFSQIGGIAANNIASWDGAKWDSVGGGISGANIYSLVSCNGELYVMGEFTSAGGIPVNNIAAWDGVKWDSVGGGVNNSGIGAMVTLNGKLFVGGYFDTAGHKPANDIAEWDGANWYPIGNGLSGGNYGIWGLGIYDSTLYAGGDFTKSGSTSLNNIAMWQGPLGVNEINEPSKNYKVFPNPANSVLNIELPLQQNETATICMYNSMGSEIRCETIKNTLTTLSVSNLTSGIYYYRITDNGGALIKADKVIIIH